MIDGQSTTDQNLVATDADVVPPGRRGWWRPKIGVKDIFWLVLLSALLMSWYRDHQRLQDEMEALSASRRRTGTSWSIHQILGPPDTLRPGDQSTAWASQTRDDALEWIVVEFPNSVAVKQLAIFETYNPGAVMQVCSVNFRGQETVLWKGTDPTSVTATFGSSIIAVEPGCRSRRFKIYLDSPSVSGWNEIDAVALQSTSGTIQWASDAWASSSYGDNRDAPTWYWP